MTNVITACRLNGFAERTGCTLQAQKGEGNERLDLSRWTNRRNPSGSFVLWPPVSDDMIIESDTLRETVRPGLLNWSSVLFGAIVAAALSAILIAFGAAVGLGVTSTSPTWRDASVALWILSGLYLILQACVSFGIGGYLASLTRAVIVAGAPEQVEERDGLHGLAAWAVATILGILIATLVSGTSILRSPSDAPGATTTAAEPLLSYELDKLFRMPRRSNDADLAAERAQAGRILLTSSGQAGMSTEDHAYLTQLVAATTGAAQGDAHRRVDTAVVNTKTAIARKRRSSVILAFSIAAALLLGAVVSWTAACAGGRHRDSELQPLWLRSRGSSIRRSAGP